MNEDPQELGDFLMTDVPTDQPPPADGAVNMHVSIDAERGLVRLDFGHSIASVSMTPDAVRSLVQALRTMANDVERVTGQRERRARGRRW